MASSLKVDTIEEKTEGSFVTFESDIKLSATAEIKDAAGNTILTEEGEARVNTIMNASGTKNVITQIDGSPVLHDDVVINADNLDSGTVPDARFPATLPAASGVNLTALNAGNLGSGTVPTARLGSGSASGSVFLAGDSSWQAAGGGGSTEMVDHQTSATTSGTGTTYTVTLDSTTYKHLMFIVQGYTTGTIPYVQFYNDDGTPVVQPDAGAQWSVSTSSSNAHTDVNLGAPNDHLFQLSPTCYGNDHAFGCTFWLYGAGDANNYINQRCAWHGYSQSNSYSPFYGGGRMYTFPNGNSWNGSERIGKFVVAHTRGAYENSKTFRGSLTTYLLK